MLITIILVIVVAIIAAAIYSNNVEIKNRIEKESEILNKYKVLINELKNDDPNSKIFKVSESSVKLGIKNIYGSIIFEIKQEVNSVLVEYFLKTNLDGNKSKLAWEFPENIDQLEMVKKIRIDITMDNLKITGMLKNF